MSRALGLMWGATKGGLIAAVIAFVLVKYEASPWIAIIPSLKEQMVESSAVSMTREHQPVPLIWTWTPVAALRDHIYDKGWMPAASEALKDATIPVKTDEAVEAASAVREPETQVAKADATRTETSVPPARATRAATPPKALTDEEFLKQVDAKFGTSPVEPAAPGSPDSR